MRIAVALALAASGCDYLAYTLPRTRTGCGGIFDCPTADVAVDTRTNLWWMRRRDSVQNYGEGEAKCAGLRAGGKNGWRIPTFEELVGLEDLTYDEWNLDDTIFPNDGGFPFFSSDDAGGGKKRGYSFNEWSEDAITQSTQFQPPGTNGLAQAGPVVLNPDSTGFVRCVRGPDSQ